MTSSAEIRACSVNFLADFASDLQSDGYGANDGLTQVNIGLLPQACRKFMETKKHQGKGKSDKADVVLAKIQKLNALESRLKIASAEERWSER